MVLGRDLDKGYQYAGEEGGEPCEEVRVVAAGTRPRGGGAGNRASEVSVHGQVERGEAGLPYEGRQPRPVLQRGSFRLGCKRPGPDLRWLDL